jgi:general secretion pathway protein B
LPKVRDLPEALRRGLPPLNVSGSMYSPDPASRMLVLDGQVLRVGQSAQPGLVVEQIGPKSAILSQQGQRFELPY